MECGEFVVSSKQVSSGRIAMRPELTWWTRRREGNGPLTFHLPLLHRPAKPASLFQHEPLVDEGRSESLRFTRPHR